MEKELNINQVLTTILINLEIADEANQLSDWYKVSRYQITSRGGGTLLRQYRSLTKLLAAMYPDFEWRSEGFAEAGKVPNDCWKDDGNLLRALDAAEQRLGIQNVHSFMLYLSHCLNPFLHLLGRGLVLGHADGSKTCRLSLLLTQDEASAASLREVSQLQMGEGVPVAWSVCPTETA